MARDDLAPFEFRVLRMLHDPDYLNHGIIQGAALNQAIEILQGRGYLLQGGRLTVKGRERLEQAAPMGTYGGHCPTCREEFELGFGLAGGGFGPYNYCATCDRVVEKTNEIDDESDE